MADSLRRSNVLQKIKVGDKITASLLNDIAISVNNNAQNLASPANRPRTFGEIARTSTTVTAAVDFEQIDTVTFRDSTGDIITLVFNNPPTV